MQVLSSSIRASSISSYKYSQKENISLLKEQSSLEPRKADSLALKINELKGNKSVEVNTEVLDSKYRSMVLALEALMGKKIEIKSFKANNSHNPTNNQSSSPVMIYENVQQEISSLDLSFEGSLSTKDGKEMSFSLSLEWNQEFVENNRLRIQDGKIFEDPLVISLDGMPPVISDKFEFNLNENAQQLNYLNANAGYLVNDANNNNSVDDGGELFGPHTSDGFAELSKYDDDNNGWIDSSDKIFKQLKLWTPTKNGDELLSLQNVGIGAISLSTTDINFVAKDSIDNPIANYKEASVAIDNKGNAYGVFSVDLAT